MKHISYLILLVIVLTSCSRRKQYDAEEYKKQQSEYEKRKAEINLVKGEFFKANKEKLLKLVELMDYLQDSNTVFKDVSTDTTFYKGDVVLLPINFVYDNYNQNTENNTTPKAKVIFLGRTYIDEKNSIISEPLEELSLCIKNNPESNCIMMEDDKLQSLLELKYAFLVDEIIKINPKVNLNNFEGGIYFAQITCFDIENNKPLLSFIASAASSESIQVYGDSQQANEMQVKRDFQSNIREGIMKSCKKHFLF